ncbi:hypothetical protein BJ138DRAFT_1130986 [Hygrophoropsis aurantiaca]|uniref:Uncharacterized protein n=1 Tax=Hygrophoropsis aurantiaca TaxID=72124 RepID=A0ACB7ZTV0_9AGAM|nr:hypothetical protein BJ138DRAFT_1130986 [Hygrophoropsis aurantiaca]
MENHTGHHDTSVRATIKIIENEVLGLREQELVLLTQLRPLQDAIARKSPVNRLPDEVLLACFGQAMRDWVVKNDGADERAVAELAYSDWKKDVDFKLPCTPTFAISHVSHRWRQLAIDDPSLWTNLVITPKFGGHWEIFEDFLRRAKGMPIAANFRSLEYGDEEMLKSAAALLTKHAQTINELASLDSGPVCSSLLSQMIEQAAVWSQSSPSIVFSCLTALSIFNLKYVSVPFTYLRHFLSAVPQLRTLELQHLGSLGAAESKDKTDIALPMLENLTIIYSNPFVCKLLDSLCAQAVLQLKLLIWDDWPLGTADVASCLFTDNMHFDSGLRLPRFPNVQNLTLSSSYDYYLNTNLIHAFPQVTHLTLGSMSVFGRIEEPSSQAPPTFQCLQRLTLDFVFEGKPPLDSHFCFTWLQKPQDRADHRPLLISVFDRSTESMEDTNKHLFRYYKELQQYGEFGGSSSRLNEFMRWQADGEPEILG